MPNEMSNRNFSGLYGRARTNPNSAGKPREVAIGYNGVSLTFHAKLAKASERDQPLVGRFTFTNFFYSFIKIELFLTKLNLVMEVCDKNHVLFGFGRGGGVNEDF